MIEKHTLNIIAQIMEENLLEHFFIVQNHKQDILVFDASQKLEVVKVDGKDDIVEILKSKIFWSEKTKQKILSDFDRYFEPIDFVFDFDKETNNAN